MEDKEKKTEELKEARQAKDLEIDESLLSEEEKAENKIKAPRGMLIFIIVLLVLIVGLSIAVLLI
jgi:hypothetical protein